MIGGFAAGGEYLRQKRPLRLHGMVSHFERVRCLLGLEMRWHLKRKALTQMQVQQHVPRRNYHQLPYLATLLQVHSPLPSRDLEIVALRENPLVLLRGRDEVDAVLASRSHVRGDFVGECTIGRLDVFREGYGGVGRGPIDQLDVEAGWVCADRLDDLVDIHAGRSGSRRRRELLEKGRYFGPERKSPLTFHSITWGPCVVHPDEFVGAVTWSAEAEMASVMSARVVLTNIVVSRG